MILQTHWGCKEKSGAQPPRRPGEPDGLDPGLWKEGLGFGFGQGAWCSLARNGQSPEALGYQCVQEWPCSGEGKEPGKPRCCAGHVREA